MPKGLARLYSFEGAEGTALPGGPWRAIYVDRGNLLAGTKPLLEEDGAFLGKIRVEIVAGSPDTRAYVWEIDRSVRAASDDRTSLAELASYEMPVLEEDDRVHPGKAILRFERVDLIPGIETSRHTHRGSGLRVLISGQLEADLDGQISSLLPGDAWLEKGPWEAVIGRASPEGQTSFVRLLVLPVAAAGEDSFVDLSGSRGDRPRPAGYRRYFEEEVML